MINSKFLTLSQALLATALTTTILNVKPASAAILTTFEQSANQTTTYFNQLGQNNDGNGNVTVYNQTFNNAVTSFVSTNQRYDSNNPTAGSVTSGYQWLDNGTLIGTYNNVYVRTADNFGGSIDPTSNGSRSNYSTVNPNSSLGGLTSSTLTFAANQKYFGLWWSAGDSRNILTFKDANDNTIGTFNSSLLTSALGSLPTATKALYQGNPTQTPKTNTGEYYAYVNFFATGNDSIRKVVFSNASSTGFESDNHAVASSYVNIRGTEIAAVPEPLTILGAATAFGFGAVFKRRSAQSQKKS